jgi:hypothetical protein
MNYNPSTIARIADIYSGIRVDTGSLTAATYFVLDTQTELFDVKGRVYISQLMMEVTAAFDANATQMLFNCTFTTPVLVANPMCAKCASLASAAQGLRVVWVGGAVATAAVITDSAGLSDVIPSKGHIVGGKNFVGTIGMLASDATQAATGAAFASIFYVPMSDGAYIAAKL